MSTNPSSNSAAEIEAVRSIYAAINRNDLSAALEFLDPRIERIEPEGFPSVGVYRGHTEVLAHLSKGRETWAEGSCEPERFLVAGDKIIAFLHVRVRLKNQQDWLDGRLTDVFTFRNGKAIEMRTFGENEEALEWVGVKDSNVTAE